MCSIKKAGEELARLVITVSIRLESGTENETEREAGLETEPEREAGPEHVESEAMEPEAVEPRTKQQVEEKQNPICREIIKFCASPRSRDELAKRFHFQSTSYLIQKYVQPLLEQGILQMTLPDRPKSKNQKFFTVRQTSETEVDEMERDAK